LSSIGGVDSVRSHRFALVTVALLLISLPLEAAPQQQASSARLKSVWEKSYNSWGMGIVVPEGASLDGGGSVGWEGATNLTSVERLPNITMPDGIIYVVLSAMGGDRSVFQVAAGSWPGTDRWYLFSWLIEGIDSVSPSYDWVANFSGPGFQSGDLLSTTIYRTSTSSWMYGMKDENMTVALGGAFPPVTATSFQRGDQEVFSLESYSRSASTFRDMGNLTLEFLFLDGRRVLGGWYSYSGWDPTHSPLFTVGGTAAPPFISLSAFGGRFSWSYSRQWGNAGSGFNALPLVVAAIVLCVVMASSFVLGRGKDPLPRARSSRS
jgi:hypothetical protein